MKSGPGRLSAMLLLAAILGATGCADLWSSRGGVIERARMSDAYGQSIYLFGDIDPEEVQVIDLPGNLRPCCAFGSGLGVSIGKLPIAGFSLDNVLSVEDLGRHNYNNGVLSMGGSEGAMISDETNGLVYTCGGRFIDIAHLRDYADWMMFFVAWVASNLETGGAVELPSEGGVRRVVLEPVDPNLIEAHRVRALSITLAEYITFRLSIWHEIITSYGWSAIALFPELASAFSPEDLYSNMLGIKIARSMVEVGATGSEEQYNKNLDRWLREVLTRLRPLDAADATLVAKGLDGYWWDSKKRLPDPLLVLKRYMHTGYEIRPWLASDAGSPAAEAALEGKCEESAGRYVMSNVSKLNDLPLAQLIRLEIEVDENASNLSLADTHDGVVTQRDFLAIIERVRGDGREALGAHFDQPGPGSDAAVPRD